MIDSLRMAIFQGIDDLDEHPLDQLILSEESELPDYRAKISSTQVIYEEGIAARVDLTMEGEYVWVGRHSRMELGFASLVVVGVGLLYALDCIVRSRLGVSGTIDDAEGPRTQDCLDPEGTVVYGLTDELGCRRRIGRHLGTGPRVSNQAPISRHLVDWAYSVTWRQSGQMGGCE